MKWKTEKPKHSSKKIIKRFALFPRRIQSTIIWLESFWIIKEYYSYSSKSDIYTEGIWYTVEHFLTKEEAEDYIKPKDYSKIITPKPVYYE